VFWAGFSNPPSVDWSCHTTFAGGVRGHVYEGFFQWDNNRGEALPVSIGSWSLSAEGTEYTFTLRDGLTFHDGTPVEAKDAVQSTDRWGRSVHPSATMIWDIIQPTTQEVVDSETWKMAMGRPFAIWPIYQAFNGVAMQPKAISETPPHECFDTKTKSIGSGPYKFIEWIPGDRVVMERFDDYTPRSDPKNGGGGAQISYFDRIEMVVIPDAATQVAGMRTGQVHIANSVAGDFKSVLQADPEITVAVIGPGRPPVLFFNKAKAPFNNKKARQAVLMAADMEKWMIASYGKGGDWKLDGQIFQSDGPWPSQVSIEKYHKPDGIDLAAATALMGEALAEEGMTFKDEIIVLAANNISYMDGGGAYTVQILESLGLNVNRPNVDWATVIQTKNSACDNWGMYHSRYGTFDPLSLEGFKANFACGWDNPDQEGLISDWLDAPTVAEQRIVVDKLQELYYEELPYIQLGSSLSLMAFRNEIAYKPTAGPFVLNGAWFK
jgi:peptide/nickel transport system substrate-binding protein